MIERRNTIKRHLQIAIKILISKFYIFLCIMSAHSLKKYDLDFTMKIFDNDYHLSTIIILQSVLFSVWFLIFSGDSFRKILSIVVSGCSDILFMRVKK